MSIKMINWVLENSPYKGSARIIHMILADIATEGYQNKAWVSIEAIAAVARVSPRTVFRTMPKMIDDGYARSKTAEPGGVATYQLVTPIDKTPRGT